MNPTDSDDKSAEHQAETPPIDSSAERPPPGPRVTVSGVGMGGARSGSDIGYDLAPPERSSTIRVFGSHLFRRLWFAQVISSLGDWIGLVAIVALADRIGGSASGGAIALVLAARVIPGFFLGPLAGVLVDRWDRKRTMVMCDIGRAAVLLTLPQIDTLYGLFFASLFLEVFTMLWQPAKEATVPRLLDKKSLPAANSLSLVAAYGTLPFGAAIFALLTKVAERLDDYERFNALSNEDLAIYFDVATFLLSALIIASLAIPGRRHKSEVGRLEFKGTIHDLKEGLVFIRYSPRVRSVILGLATGLIGGGMVVPLGPIFAREVLGGGKADFTLLIMALGMGVATGIIGLSALQKRIAHDELFVLAALGAGISLGLAASMSALTPAIIFVACLGLCAGAAYVLGFTILQSDVEDELRGRVFAALYTVIRLCIILALIFAPLFSDLLDRLSSRLVNRSIDIGFAVALPGVRLTLWLAASIIVIAAGLAWRSLKMGRRANPPSPAQAANDEG